ncbi:MAG: hypothetical protein ACK5SR_00580 [Burkholderiales bacterium]|jgi:hypothetical protein
MQMTANDLAWMKAQALYAKGDTAEQAGIKALQEGYQPATPAYNAFIKGFLELVDSASASTESMT